MITQDILNELLKTLMGLRSQYSSMQASYETPEGMGAFDAQIHGARHNRMMTDLWREIQGAQKRYDQEKHKQQRQEYLANKQYSPSYKVRM